MDPFTEFLFNAAPWICLGMIIACVVIMIIFFIVTFPKSGVVIKKTRRTVSIETVEIEDGKTTPSLGSAVNNEYFLTLKNGNSTKNISTTLESYSKTGINTIYHVDLKSGDRY